MYTNGKEFLGKLPDLFYEKLKDKWEDEKIKNSTPCRISSIIDMTYLFFKEPIHPCVSCNNNFYYSAQSNKKRNEIILRYVLGGMCKHPELFNGNFDKSWLVPELNQALDTRLYILLSFTCEVFNLNK